MQHTSRHLFNALARGAERATTFAGPQASALCLLAQRRTAGPMGDRRRKRGGRSADRRRAVSEQA